MNDPVSDFNKRNSLMIGHMAADQALQKLTRDWVAQASKYEYSYHFKWLGRPIIQFPQDMLAMQEIIWSVKPDLIVETGVAHGGSLIFYASILELLGRDGHVLGIDIDIKPHNKSAIESHPLSHRIFLLEGSSIEKSIIDRVYRAAKDKKKVLVALDSNHTHEHVLEELRLYSPLVVSGSYLIVFDTLVEQMPEDFYPNRPWGRGNNPDTAVKAFLSENDRFQIDQNIASKLLITASSSGYLKCLKNQ